MFSAFFCGEHPIGGEGGGLGRKTGVDIGPCPVEAATGSRRLRDYPVARGSLTEAAGTSGDASPLG